MRVLCPPHPTGHPGPPAVARHGEQYHSRPCTYGHHTHSSHEPYPYGSPFSHGPHLSGPSFSHGPHLSGPSFSQGPHPYSSQFMHEAGPHPLNPYPPKDRGVTAPPVPPELVNQFGAMYTSSQWGNPQHTPRTKTSPSSHDCVPELLQG